MGRAIDREQFTERDHELFEERLHENLDALAELLDRPGFGEGTPTMGAELEVHLVDSAGRADPVNRAVVEAAHEPQLTVEIAKYNVEVNTRPIPVVGAAFGYMAAQLSELLTCVRSAAARFGARAVVIGILPTLQRGDLLEDMLTDESRYRALGSAVRRLRGGPCKVHIEGRNGRALDLVAESVAVLGANTSFQVHLRVPPRNFAAVYNAVQLATAPTLAVSGNSPLFLEHELWEETRIALFPQGFDVRCEGEEWRPARVGFGTGWCKRGILELFAESVAQHPALLPLIGRESAKRAVERGELPKLEELRLHQGTVWHWNRPIYDDADGGHLRIEMRALPAGPTVIDMTANAAFIVGLALGLAPDIARLTSGLTFAEAMDNFSLAAKDGLDAQLLWPCDHAPSPRRESARSLVRRLVPAARRGLVAAGVDAGEAERLLAVIEARAAIGQTGAAWQRHIHQSRLARLGKQAAPHALLESYLTLSHHGRPVHEWTGI